MTTDTAAAPTGPTGPGDAPAAQGATVESATGPAIDPFDTEMVLDCPGLLADFNRSGVLAAADVHVAVTLGRLTGETDERALLAAALAVRAPRLGHVCVDLKTASGTVTAEEDPAVDLGALAWPHPGSWRSVVAASPLTDGGSAPLRLDGSTLYLDRYWRYEQRVLTELRRRAATPDRAVEEVALVDGLDRLFPRQPQATEPDLQREAAATAVRRRLTVIAGGPGTGKTHTVANVLALLLEQARALDEPPPRLALAAPTGKAAARLEESIRGSASGLRSSAEVRATLAELHATTLHRLLRRHPANRSRFRHDGDNPLPHDVVVVDETSMVSLSLMAKLLEAVRPDARIVLLGDPDQLFSVEAGAVLGDIVGGAHPDPAPAVAQPSPAATSPDPAAGRAHPAVTRPAMAGSICWLRRVHRFAEDSGIAALAEAVRGGDADAAVRVLGEGRPDVHWLPVAAEDVDDGGAAVPDVRDAVVATGTSVLEAARAGDAQQALQGTLALRILCTHRRGPAGVGAWVPRVEGWLGARGHRHSARWYLGRPVLVTRNDHQLGIANGDVGVLVAREGRGPAVAFADGGEVRWVSPVRLEAVETVHAMTIHKSQGSQFDHVIVVLPDTGSRLLTRELLYTAVTRAQKRLTVLGADASVRAAVQRRVQRASGLTARLWT